MVTAYRLNPRECARGNLTRAVIVRRNRLPDTAESGDKKLFLRREAQQGDKKLGGGDKKLLLRREAQQPNNPPFAT